MGATSLSKRGVANDTSPDRIGVRVSPTPAGGQSIQFVAEDSPTMNPNVAVALAQIVRALREQKGNRAS